jgi:hypothetical protein
MVALFLLFNYRDVLKGRIRWLGAKNSFRIKNLDGLITLKTQSLREICMCQFCVFIFFYYISR